MGVGVERISRVYPRVCGGTPPAAPCMTTTTGLSPRVRGNRCELSAVRVGPWSIPACAGEPHQQLRFPSLAPVYPRVCGGTATPAATEPDAPGLSPRVRGNLRRAVTGAMGHGSIPACAGEPLGIPTDPTWARVYPRVCGGTIVVQRHEGEEEGLSPRVRGNLGHLHQPPPQHGSIPACAGEPGPATRRCFHQQVYPRVCGGTRPGLGDQRHQIRSIPACAGEPARCAWRSRREAVYPRVCGGTLRRAVVPRLRQGLSPRVRGNLEQKGADERAAGSIPACAGEPQLPSPNRWPAEVYPRVCGGTPVVVWPTGWERGLSPRVRGNRGGRRPILSVRGSIPACAGEPLPGSKQDGTQDLLFVKISTDMRCCIETFH